MKSWVAIVAFCTSIALLAYLPNRAEEAPSYGNLAVLSLAVTIASVALLVARWGRDITSGPLLYLTLFLIFHLGVVLTIGIGGISAVAAVSPTAHTWVASAYFQPAVRYAALAALVFALVCALVGPKTKAFAPPLPSQSHVGSEKLARAGLVLQLAGLALFLVSLEQSGGLSLLVGGYLTFLENVESSGVAYAIWAFGVGSCLSQLGSRGQRRAGLTIYLAYAAVLFPLGLRGSVLFPGVVLLATRSRTGRPLRASVLAAVSLAVLTLAALVRTTRIGGNPEAQGAWYDRALSTVTELGFSLRPVGEVLRWADSGQPHTHFISFVAVPVRLLEKFTGWHGGPPVVDERLFNVKVNSLAGPIGGSPVAEAYDAGGGLGVVVVMAALAVAICVISRLELSSPLRCAAFPIILLPLVTAVRNSFAPVLPQVAIGLLLAYVVTRVELRRSGTRLRSDERMRVAPPS